GRDRVHRQGHRPRDRRGTHGDRGADRRAGPAGTGRGAEDPPRPAVRVDPAPGHRGRAGGLRAVLLRPGEVLHDVADRRLRTAYARHTTPHPILGRPRDYAGCIALTMVMWRVSFSARSATSSWTSQTALRTIRTSAKARARSGSTPAASHSISSRRLR